MRHLVTLPLVERAAVRCGFDFEKLQEGLEAGRLQDDRQLVLFSKPPVQEGSEDDMELRYLGWHSE
jgi:hypothetical protein